MRFLNFTLLALLLLNCKGNASLFGLTASTNPVTDRDGGKEGDSTEKPEPREPLELITKSAFHLKGKSLHGDWVTDFDLKGDLSDKTRIRIIKRNATSGAILFAGDFLPGDDLHSAIPQNVEGTLDWASDFAPFYKEGSILSDGSRLGFDKKAWAKHLSAQRSDLQYYQNVLTHELGTAIGIETEYQVLEDKLVSSSKTLEGVKYHYSYDDDALVEESTNEKKRDGIKFSSTLSVGGPIFASSSIYEIEDEKLVDILDHDKTWKEFFQDRKQWRKFSKTMCQSFRLIGIKKDLKRVNAIKKNNVWIDQSVESNDMAKAIAKTLGADTFKRQGSKKYDWDEPIVDCVDMIQYYFVSSAIDKTDISHVRVGFEKDSGINASYVDIALVQYESY